MYLNYEKQVQFIFFIKLKMNTLGILKPVEISVYKVEKDKHMGDKSFAHSLGW